MPRSGAPSRVCGNGTQTGVAPPSAHDEKLPTKAANEHLLGERLAPRFRLAHDIVVGARLEPCLDALVIGVQAEAAPQQGTAAARPRTKLLYQLIDA